MNTKMAQSLLTKFFYQDNYLHFQILVQTEQQTQVAGEFTDYAEYRKAFDALQMRLMRSWEAVGFSEKVLKPEAAFAKMA